jgi:nucleotide-binding universal stress UspA family protein
MYRRILVPIDGSGTAARGLDEAIALAKDQHARLRFVHVVEEYSVIQSAAGGGVDFFVGDLIDLLQKEGKSIIARALALAKKRGVAADACTLESFTTRSADFIVAEAKKWRADLIVMGTHGRRGVSRMVLGSDAEIIVRSSPCPVLLVRSPGAAAKPGTRARAKPAAKKPRR